MPKDTKSPFQVDVRRSRASLLKFPNVSCCRQVTFIMSERYCRQYQWLCRSNIAGSTSGYVAAILQAVPVSMSEQYCRQYQWPRRSNIAGSTSGYVGSILQTVPVAMSEQYCGQYQCPCRSNIAGSTSGHVGAILQAVPVSMSEQYCRQYQWLCRSNIAYMRTPRNSPRIRHRSEYTEKAVHGIGNCIL